MANAVAGFVGDAFMIALILAPVDTMLRIKWANSVGDRSVYNYVGAFANAVAWVGYAAPSRGWFLAGTNIAAIVFEFAYTCFYYRYAQGRAKRFAFWGIVAELIWGFLMLIIYFAAFYGGRNEEVRVLFFGLIAGGTALIMYGGMLPDMLAVIRTHDIAQQSIVLLVVAVGNCTSWIVFSTNPVDRIVLVPNSIGVLLTAIQSVVWVAVWIRYRNAAPQQPQPPVNNQQNQQSLELA